MAKKKRRPRTLRANQHRKPSAGGSRRGTPRQNAVSAIDVPVLLVGECYAQDDATRQQAVEALGERLAQHPQPRGRATRDVLIQRLNDIDPKVRLGAAAGLQPLIRDEEVADAIQTRLKIEQDPDVRSRLETTASLLSGGTSRGIRPSMKDVEPNTDEEKVAETYPGAGFLKVEQKEDGQLADLQRQARNRFLSELPSLLEKDRGKWVAYTADERVALDTDPAIVYQACCTRGLRPGDFVLCVVEPDAPPVVEI